MNQTFTTGHPNHQLDEFVSLLESNHVATIANVRRYPGSKSFTQFNKKNLAEGVLEKTLDIRILKNLAEGEKKASKRQYMITVDDKTSPLDPIHTMPTTSFIAKIKELHNNIK